MPKHQIEWGDPQPTSHDRVEILGKLNGIQVARVTPVRHAPGDPEAEAMVIWPTAD